jgi:hypothetical protein
MGAYEDLKKLLGETQKKAGEVVEATYPAVNELKTRIEELSQGPRTATGLPTEQEIRQSLSLTPTQYRDSQFEKLAGAIQDQGEFDLPEILLDPQGRPSSIKAYRKNIQGHYSDPEIIEPPEGFWEDQAAFEEHQQGLVKRLEEHGDTISGWSRLARGVKYTPEGSFNYLVDTYGKENVLPVFNEEKDLKNIIIMDQGVPKLVDKSGLEWKDLLDIAPEVAKFGLAMGSSILASRRGGGFKKVAATEAGADLFTEAAHQAVSKVLPGEDFPGMTPSQEAATRGQAGAVAAVMGAGANVAAEGLRQISPLVRAERAIGKQKIPRTPEELMAGTGKEARKRAQEIAPAQEITGVPLDVLERTGAPLASTLKRLFESFPGSVDVMSSARRVKLQKFGDALDNLASAAAKGKRAGAEPATAMIAKAYKKIGDEIYEDFRTRAAKHFDSADTSGAKIPLENFHQTVTDILENASTPARTGPVQSILDFAKTHLNELGQAGSSATPRQMQNMLSDYGKRALGKGKLWAGEISHTESQRIASKLVASLRKDLDSAVDSGAAGAEALRQARGIYHQGFQALEAAKDSVLEKSVKLYDKGNPEKFVDSIMSNAFSKSDIARAMDTLTNSGAASEAMALRGAVLDKMARDATSGVEETVGQPGKFLTMYKKNKPQLEGLLGNDPKALKHLDSMARIAERIQQGGIAEGSRSNPVLTSLWMLGPKQAATLVGLLTLGKSSDMMRFLARAFNNPEAREMLLMPPPKGWLRKVGGLSAKGAKIALSRLIAYASRDRYLFPLVQEPERGTIGQPEQQAETPQRPEEEDATAKQAEEWANFFSFGGGKL